jgi:hypothetical protein
MRRRYFRAVVAAPVVLVVWAVASSCGAIWPGGAAYADLAYAAKDGGVFVAHADGSDGRELARGVCSPQRGGVVALSLSPGGRQLAFSCGIPEGSRRNGLYLADLTSGQPRRVSDEVADTPGSLARSPDGNQLAYLVPVNAGPAPVEAMVVTIHNTKTGRQNSLDRPRYFIGPLAWEPDGSAVVDGVGSWQHATGIVLTYRIPLDGNGGVPWRTDVKAVVPGPGGRWLGTREPRGREGRGIAVVIGPDGATTALAPPGSQPSPSDVTDFPIGWLNGVPVVRPQTTPGTRDSHGRGEVTTSLHLHSLPGVRKKEHAAMSTSAERVSEDSEHHHRVLGPKKKEGDGE